MAILPRLETGKRSDHETTGAGILMHDPTPAIRLILPLVVGVVALVYVIPD
jgi:hypothetical protein